MHDLNGVEGVSVAHLSDSHLILWPLLHKLRLDCVNIHGLQLLVSGCIGPALIGHLCEVCEGSAIHHHQLQGMGDIVPPLPNRSTLHSYLLPQRMTYACAALCAVQASSKSATTVHSPGPRVSMGCVVTQQVSPAGCSPPHPKPSRRETHSKSRCVALQCVSKGSACTQACLLAFNHSDRQHYRGVHMCVC